MTAYKRMCDGKVCIEILRTMITPAFAEIVGLLCHYRQEKGDREALDHEKVMEWLEYHRNQSGR
jgi:hypothetical protein